VTDFDMLDAAQECTGHVPEPWTGFLDFVLTLPKSNPARVELLALCVDVVRGVDVA
jgi:hypothetical protein